MLTITEGLLLHFVLSTKIRLTRNDASGLSASLY